jgi:RluA family pseudouridine synthase
MELAAEPCDDGLDLLEFLSACLIGLSKTRLRRLIGDGLVTVDGRKVGSKWTVQPGQVVCLPDEAVEPDDLSPALTLQPLLEDEHHLAVNKPPGHTVLPTRTGGGREFFNGLIRLLNPPGPGPRRFVRPHIVHRLDRDTSGVLLVAKTAEAGRRLALQFQRRQTRKRYLAVLEGVPPRQEFTVELPLARKRGSVLAMTVEPRKGKPARTLFRLLRPFGRFSLVEARPETGRQHQIRVHAAAVGFPLAVDVLYGRRRLLTAADLDPAAPAAEPVLERCPLHAAEIHYRHPADRSPRRAEAPLAPDIERLLTLLEAPAGPRAKKL